MSAFAVQNPTQAGDVVGSGNVTVAFFLTVLVVDVWQHVPFKQPMASAEVMPSRATEGCNNTLAPSHAPLSVIFSFEKFA
jgi:hypothetical protein